MLTTAPFLVPIYVLLCVVFYVYVRCLIETSLILEWNVYCGPDKFYGRSKFGQYDEEKYRTLIWAISLLTRNTRVLQKVLLWMFNAQEDDMHHSYYVYISTVLSYINMWNFEGILPRSELILPIKVASVIYTGLYLNIKRKNVLK